MTDTRDRGERLGTGRRLLMVRWTSFFLPLVLAGAYLNLGQSSCDALCQGLVATHVFTTDNFATNGNDVIVVTEPNLNIVARGGNDTVCVVTDDGRVTIYGGPGDDAIYAGDGGSTLRGEDGDDTLIGGAGVDIIHGGPGDDTIEGGDDIDYVFAGANNDVVYGGAGNDWLLGEDGNDWVMGDDGNDMLWGGAGGNWLQGGAGNDTLWVGDEGGILDGGPGNDTGYECASLTNISFGVESLGFDDHCAMESEGVFLARLEVWMCNSSGAENNEGLMISLNGVEAEKRFLGDYPASPWFPRSSRHVYDFLVGGELRDIKEISIRSQAANDAFCLSRVRLGVNHFTEGTTDWKWLFDTEQMETRVEEGATLTYSLIDLRSHIDWRRANFMPLLEISGNKGINNTGLDYETLERLLEGLIEEAIRGRDDVAWDGSELVSVEQGYGDDVGPSTTDACNELDEALCGLDWSDPDAVCDVFPDNMFCAADCYAHPGDWACSWDWEARGLAMDPCIWRLNMCHFPNHADIHVDLQKARFEARDEIDVDLVLKVLCQDDQLRIEPDKFHVDAQGLAGGRVAERRVGNAITGIAAGFTQTFPVPDPLSCQNLDPYFDECGLWIGFPNPTRPNLPGDTCQ